VTNPLWFAEQTLDSFCGIAAVEYWKERKLPIMSGQAAHSIVEGFEMFSLCKRPLPVLRGRCGKCPHKPENLRHARMIEQQDYIRAVRSNATGEPWVHA
jgi:hypothetical protein